MSGCPSIAEILRVLHGTSPDAEEDEISRHVEQCSPCQRELERLTALPPTPDLLPGARRDLEQLEQLRGLLPTGGHELEAAAPSVGWPVVPGYEIHDVLGRGGMAVVYRATQARPRRPVALKMLGGAAPTSPEQIVRFAVEGEILARLRHPNILPIYEVGIDPRHPYLAIELVEGGSLDHALNGKPIAPRDAAKMVEILARAVEHAHSQGIIHRDLKPANILLSGQPGVSAADAVLKVTDFGLAKVVGTDAGLTRTGTSMGTPSYMAPEQVRGQGDQIGPRTDIYSLGAILYEAVTGRPPFLAASSLDVLDQVLRSQPVPPSRLLTRLPRDLEVVCLKCLEKEAERRYPTAAALADDLGRFQRGESILARRPGPIGRARRWAVRRPAIAGLLLALFAAVVVGLATSTFFAIEAGRRATLAFRREIQAQAASRKARAAEDRSSRGEAELLLDRGVRLAHQGRISEGMHWMIAALKTSPDPDFRRLVRVDLASWGARIPTLVHWLDTPHRHLAFAPDGRTVATAGPDAAPAADRRVSLRLWDLETGQPRGGPLVGDDLALHRLLYSPDGRTLLTGNGGIQPYQRRPGWATLWDVASRRMLRKVVGHSDGITAIAWRGDGRTFLTGSRDGTVIVWDTATGRPLGQSWITAGGVEDLTLSPDGRWAMVLTERSSRLFDATSGEPVGPMLAEGRVRSAAFGEGARTLLVGLTDDDNGMTTARLWRFDPASRHLHDPRDIRLASGLLSTLPDGRIVPEGPISPDGSHFARVDDGLQVWTFPRDRSTSVEDLAIEPPLTPLDPPAAAMFGPDGRTAWFAPAGAGQLRALDITVGLPLGVRFPDAPFPPGRLHPSAICAAAGTIATAYRDTAGTQLLRVWDVARGVAISPPVKVPNTILTQTISPDGRLLAVGGHFHEVGLLDAKTGRLVGPPLATHNMILDLRFSPDGRWLAAANYGGEVRVWDVVQRSLLFPPLEHGDDVVAVRFAPDGKQLATLTSTAAHLWDPRTGRKLATLRFARSADSTSGLSDDDLLYSPDGSTLLASSGRGSFRLWDTVDYRPRGSPTADGPPGRAKFAFHPSGEIVIVGREDGTAQCWDARTHHPLGAPAIQPVGVIGVAFTPDGQAFQTITSDGRLRRWPIPAPWLGDMEQVERAVMIRTGLRMDEGRTVIPLTRREWQAFRKFWLNDPSDRRQDMPPECSAMEWHEARIIESAQRHHPTIALWHLHRLLTGHPQDRLEFRLKSPMNLPTGWWRSSLEKWRWPRWMTHAASR